MQKLSIRTATLVGLALVSLAPSLALAGALNSPAAPTEAGSAMYSTEAIYNRLQSGAGGAKRSGAFGPPTSGPAATGRSLDEIMSIAPAPNNTTGAMPSDVRKGRRYWGLRTAVGAWGLKAGTAPPAAVARSGQTVSSAPGDDGALKKGVAWPTPRLVNNSNGTVTDKLTGLIWLRKADCFTGREWSAAMAAARSLKSGECGLTDGSVAGAWRLPQIQELKSLVNRGRSGPALPGAGGAPFTGVQYAEEDKYWTSTVFSGDSSGSWFVSFDQGIVYNELQANIGLVWPVRDGQ